MPVILAQSPAPQNKKTSKTEKDPQNCKNKNQTKQTKTEKVPPKLPWANNWFLEFLIGTLN